MNRLSTDKRAQIIGALVEGNSIRATCRMTGAAKGTVLKLLNDMGTVCSIQLDRMLRDLPCERCSAAAWPVQAARRLARSVRLCVLP